MPYLFHALVYFLCREKIWGRTITKSYLTCWCHKSDFIQRSQRISVLILNFLFIWYGRVILLYWKQHVTETLSQRPKTAGLTSQADVKEARISSGRDTGILHVNTGDGRAALSCSQQLCKLVAHWTPELRYVCVCECGSVSCQVILVCSEAYVWGSYFVISP